MDTIITVDTLGNAIGEKEKMECHRVPVLHRAFSIFLCNGKSLLMQKRNINKYHSGGLWTNACCSHHRSGVDFNINVQMRLAEELGISCQLRELHRFVYFHKFNDNLYEYEFDHVFLGYYNGELKPDPQEIEELRWIEIDELASDILINPQRYSVWLHTALTPVLNAIALGEN